MDLHREGEGGRERQVTSSENRKKLREPREREREGVEFRPFKPNHPPASLLVARQLPSEGSCVIHENLERDGVRVWSRVQHCHALASLTQVSTWTSNLL